MRKRSTRPSKVPRKYREVVSALFDIIEHAALDQQDEAAGRRNLRDAAYIAKHLGTDWYIYPAHRKEIP